MALDSLSRQRRSIGQLIAKVWLETYFDVRNDIWSTKWLRGMAWFPFICLLGGHIYAILSFSGICNQSITACDPSGSFTLEPSQFRFWELSGVFQITLGWGSLSFANAKAIDIMWDVVVGRGGQAVLAFISWRIFAMYVTTSMESGPATYETYWTIFLQSDPTIISILQIIYDFSRRRGVDSKAAMIFIVSTMIYISAFPTLVGAMTGYSANVRSFVPDRNNNLIQFNSYKPALYVIHDGWRINSTTDYLVVRDDNPEVEPILEPQLNGDPCLSIRRGAMNAYTSCYLQNNVSNYTAKYGFYGQSNSSSTFMGYTLSAPVLNISAFSFYGREPLDLFGED